MSTDVKGLANLMSGSGEEKELIDKLTYMFTSWQSARAGWEAECDEVDLFLDATDTRTTTNNKLPFKNSTTINKLSQLHMNMTTAYMEHLIPNRDWVDFVGADVNSISAEKREAVRAYVRGKAEASNLEGVLERLTDDFVSKGITIAHTRHIKKMSTTVENMLINNYTGTVTERIDPRDFYYDVTAKTLRSAAKCIRQLHTVGGLLKEIRESTNPVMTEEQFQQLMADRKTIRESIGDGYTGRQKWNRLSKQGFGDMMAYINEGIIEVLTFYGDFYNEDTGELWLDHEITLIDRKMIGRKQPLSTWNNSQNLHISVWEFRKGCLAPMSPLARVVGLQYKLDKRENFREDMHDKFLEPSLKKVGDVREVGVRGAPGHTFEVEEGGDAVWMTPPVEALQPDQQLFVTMNLMEELSGAPKEAIGQRTPGEKTKFEVQLLDQGQSKTFRRKVKKFERELLSPVLQDYLEQGRHHLDGSDMVKSYGSELGTTEFLNVTADDLNGNGTMVARGATLFAEKANTLQNVNAILSSPAGQIVGPHLSRKKFMRMLEDVADLSKYDLFTFGVGVQEDQEVARLAQAAQGNTQEQSLTLGQEKPGEPQQTV